VAEVATAGTLGTRQERGRSFWSRFGSFFLTLARKKPLGFFGLVVLLLMVVVAIFPGVFATNAPEANSGVRFQKYCIGPTDTPLCPTIREEDPLLPNGGRVVEGDISVPLGTDQLGRDIYSRIVWGARVAMYVGLGAVFISSLIALIIGVTTAYFGGAVDTILQRVVDAVMALPPLVILVSLPTLIGGWDIDGGLPFDKAGITNTKLLLILGILGGASGSRVIRAAVIGVRSNQYLEAATVLGASHLRIMLRHIVPNIFGPLMVQATIALGGVIITEVALSYLGLGDTDPRRPSWGQMLQLANNNASTQPLQVIWPGVAIALAVFSFNMLGDALRDLLDPRLRGARGNFG
jgi:peptide/nickel transport system permease protein